MRKVVITILIATFCLSLSSAGFAQRREDLEAIRKDPAPFVVFATLPPGERQELIQLRASDPEEFKKVVAKRIRERVRELQEIEQEDSQRFEEIKQKAIVEVKTYTKQLKEDVEVSARFKKAADRVKGKQELRKHLVFESLPNKKKERIIALREKYQEALETALKERTEELEVLKKEDPEEFKAIIQEAMNSAKERMAKGRRKKSKAFERFGKMKLEYLKEKLEWLKSEDPELYQYLIKRGSAGHRDSR